VNFYHSELKTISRRMEILLLIIFPLAEMYYWEQVIEDIKNRFCLFSRRKDVSMN
jgi:hypothetical protein